MKILDNCFPVHTVLDGSASPSIISESGDRNALQPLSLLICMLGVIAMSGCGGGGNTMGEGMTMPPDSSVPPDSVPSVPSDPTPPDSARSTYSGLEQTLHDPSKYHTVALASPRAGSITQSSSVLDGVSADSIHVSFVPHDNGVHPVARIYTGDGGTFESNEDPTRMVAILPSGEIVSVDPRTEWRSIPPFSDVQSASYFPQRIFELDDIVYYSREFEEQWAETDEDGHTYYSCSPTSSCEEYERQKEAISIGKYLDHPKTGRRIQGVMILDLLGGGSFVENEDGSEKVVGNPKGMMVVGSTDYQSGESDYLVWGWWGYYAFTPSDVDFNVGAFADGMETEFSAVPNLGSATYSGYTEGTLLNGAAPGRLDVESGTIIESGAIFDFIGEVVLTADFASASISGTANNFRGLNIYEEPHAVVDEVLGDDGFVRNLEVTLGSAHIEPSSSTHSFFEGTVSATGLSGATGKWGGQFFGRPGSDGDPPPSVGGTWGVTQGEGAGDWTMIGGFAAWR